jgi:integrase
METTRPAKPYAGFPLSAGPNGQWWKRIKTKPYYFGSWKVDATGTAALADYNRRLPGILSGADHLRSTGGSGGVITLGDVLKRFLEQCKTDVASGSLSLPTYGGYIEECGAFTEWATPSIQVSALKPDHFTAYHNDQLVAGRKLRAKARKRTMAYVKRMFNWASGNVGGCPAVEFGDGFKAPNTTPEALRKEKTRFGLKDHSKRIVTGEEIDKLVALANPNFRAIILLAANCGLGPADIGRLQWDHFDMETGKLDFPRGKTGSDRKGYLWQRTRDAIRRASETKYAKLERAKGNKTVFITKKGLAYYREQPIVTAGKVVGVKVDNAISITFGRLVRKLDMEGVTMYRLRHTFKTLGKKARDPDALNVAMGHVERGTGATYDHEEISYKRIKRVALKVKGRLWPKPKEAGQSNGTMRLVG